MEIEKELNKEESIAFLRQLANALENGQSFSITEDKSIAIPKNLGVSVEYEENDDEIELEIELSWSKSHQSQQGKFEVFAGKSEWYFRLKASNGQTILSSEGYKSKQGAEKGVASVKKNANEAQIEYRTSKSDQPYFVLKAANGEIIGTSQMYKRQSSCEKGARSVINHASAADVLILE